MTVNEIEQKTIEAAAIAFRRSVNEIKSDIRFAEDLKSKSFHLFQLAMLLEEKFGVKIPFADLKRNITIADTVKLVEQTLA